MAESQPIVAHAAPQPNAAGLVVAGPLNPNWRGGLVNKTCEHCGTLFKVRPGAAHKARYCTLACWNAIQASKKKTVERFEDIASLTKECELCGNQFKVFPSHFDRSRFCGKQCANRSHAMRMKSSGNPSWNGGVSRLPYPHDWSAISAEIIERDGSACQNPQCRGTDQRLVAHHIDYDKTNCNRINLICLCSACNSSANFGRHRWRVFYQTLMTARALLVS